MQIKMLEAIPVSPDGLQVIYPEKGEELELRDDLAEMIIEAKLAEEVKPKAVTAKVKDEK